MKKNQKDLLLLPYYFRGIALGILVLGFLFAGLSLGDVISIEKETVRLITEELILVALLLFAITKSRVEDELTLRIRLKAFTASFIFGVVGVIINPLINLVFDGRFVSDSKLSGLLIAMFFFYFLMMFLMKCKR